ncbi:hypothetical protein B0H66DRAFT_260528 [Apodospora peruviana]|uniref:Uncharacterized protein n=1 Tax=Apodospora peruviana TaxID=516989 RepID=A0AAE0I6T3_9PEZI|nr:hypothetical protein B0H66DRAFT_260528 [Apodospora peruviana]
MYKTRPTFQLHSHSFHILNQHNTSSNRYPILTSHKSLNQYLLKMQSIIALTISGLALTTAMTVEPRQATPVVNVISARRLDGDCPAGSFTFTPNNADRPFGTIVFGNYTAFVGPKDQSSSRERFCNFEVVLQFPRACTKGDLLVQPRGFVQLGDARTTATFSSANVLPGKIGQDPAALSWTGPLVPEQNYVRNWQLPFQEDIRNENERNIVYAARTRIFVTQPGPNQESFLTVDSLDIGVLNPTTC